ncbi:MAG: hypothetical protein DKT66_24370 [Candidatus Melainabacteria bacterium]|nr:MAG: hypothetical protein DKT66_24370 [Candidatus Melainabacteria bacterium]
MSNSDTQYLGAIEQQTSALGGARKLSFKMPIGIEFEVLFEWREKMRCNCTLLFAIWACNAPKQSY